MKNAGNDNRKSQFKKYATIGGIIAAVTIAAAALFSLSGQNNSQVVNSSQNQGPVLSAAPESAQIQQGLQVGNAAPDFSLVDPEKGRITKQTFTGKPLFIFFTTTYCTPCQIGAQNFAKYDDETDGDAFNVLIVFVDDREKDEQFLEWKKKFGRDDWYVAKGIDMAQTYRVQYLDTKYVFDEHGIIKWVNVKPLEYQTSKQVLEPLLQ